MMLLRSAAVLLTILPMLHCADYAYSQCNTSAVLSPADLSCSGCPTNSIPNNYEAVATSCICGTDYWTGNDNACTLLSNACTASNQYFSKFERNGNANGAAATYQTCDSNAYANA